jgi:hypothetical protein
VSEDPRLRGRFEGVLKVSENPRLRGRFRVWRRPVCDHVVDSLAKVDIIQVLHHSVSNFWIHFKHFGYFLNCAGIDLSARGGLELELEASDREMLTVDDVSLGALWQQKIPFRIILVVIREERI